MSSDSINKDFEQERVRALLRYDILDTPDESEFDDITKVAAYLCNANCAQINFLDHDRQWSKSCYGWDIRVIPRKESICKHTIQQEKYLVINDVNKDPRFKDYNYVKEKKVQFYAGVVLKSSHGYNIGTLCVFDNEPGELTEEQLESLQILGHDVETKLELRIKREQLVEEHKKLLKTATFLKNATDIMLILDPDNLEIIEINEGVKKLLGYGVEEIRGTVLTDYTYQEDFKNQLKEWVQGSDTSSYSEEVKFTAKDGEPVWLQVSLSKEMDKYYVTAKNITRRKRAEQRFLKQLKFTEDIIQHLPGLFFLLNKKGVVKKWNNNLEETTKRTFEEVKEKSYREFVAKEDHDRAAAAFQTIFEEGYARTEIKIISGEREIIPLLLVGFRYQADEEVYAIGIGINITEEKKALEELERKEQKLKKAQRIGKMGSWTWNVLTNELYWSDEVYELYDLDRNRFSPTFENFMEMLPEGEVEKVEEVIERILDGKEWEEIELRVQKPDGTVLYIHERGEVHYDSEGNPIEVSGTMQDVTARREYEEKLKSTLKEKEALLKEVHHRVKNNLAIINGLFQLEIFNTEDEQLHFSLSKSQGRIKSMALIHETLYASSDFANISYDSYLEELTSSIMSTFVKKAENIKIELDTENLVFNINQAIPSALLVNELITNALKHAFPNSNTGTISVILQEKEGFVHLSVKDDGVGMDPDIDIENPKTLGLTLIRHLVKQLNGELKLSEKGGTTFTVIFQRKETKGSSASYFPKS